jgi:trans-2,3-dihydro-3-hydroxyanthranilate isomerase
MNSQRSYRYRLVDVFTAKALEGNALAVFLDSSGLDDTTMQRIAKEMNLSETVFLGPPTREGCAAGVRIFTPARELRFAGHPTIGTAFVLMEQGIVPKGTTTFVLDEKIGPVPIRVEPGQPPLIWLSTPPMSWGRTYDRDLCAKALGLDPADLLTITPQVVSAGNPALFIAVKNNEAVDRSWIDRSGVLALKGADPEQTCIFVFTPTSTGAYSRMFAPDLGVPEDPATGSTTGPLAAYMIRHELVSGADGARFFSEQGVKMGRRSILYVQVHGDQGKDGIDVGGYVTPVAEGTLTL